MVPPAERKALDLADINLPLYAVAYLSSRRRRASGNVQLCFMRGLAGFLTVWRFSLRSAPGGGLLGYLFDLISANSLIPLARFYGGKIQAFEQHHQVATFELDRRVLAVFKTDLGKVERAFRQPFREDADTIDVPPE